MGKINILRKIIDNRLCVGCGSCFSVCLNNAIIIDLKADEGIYIPSINEDLCVDCGRCVKVCPALEFDHLKLSCFDIDSTGSSNKLIGNYIKCYVGYSTDQNLRKNSSSGGLVSELTRFLLTDEYISGAILAKMNALNPLVPEPFIAKSENDVHLGAGSKYCPVPMNSIFKNLAKNKENYAFVGLPCHIKGLRKMQINNKVYDNIKFSLGLVCNHTPNLNSLKFIMKTLSIDVASVKSIQFRGNGWPGQMNINLKDGSNISVPHFSELYWGFVNAWFFWPLRCTLCKDKINTFADISFMDAWHRLYNSDNLGTSLIIVRSEMAESIVNKAKVKGKIVLEEVDSKMVMESQRLQDYYYTVENRRNYLVSINKSLKDLIPVEENPRNNLNFYSSLFYFRNYLSQKEMFWPAINFLRLMASQYKKITGYSNKQ